MQILTRNGGITPEFECEFKKTIIISKPDGATFLQLSEDDLSDALRTSAVLEYEFETGDRQHKELEFYLAFQKEAMLYAFNPANSKSVGRQTQLSKTELLIVKNITCMV